MALLEVDKLCISFKTDSEAFQAVKQLSFTLEMGESLAIVGESGSGKSVSTRAIMGLLEKSSLDSIGGSLRYNGESLIEADEEVFRNLRGSAIAMIFQEPMTALNPVMRCGEQVSESIRLHKQLQTKAAKINVLELFQEVLLPQPERIFSSYPHELSGGQRQRVMIAMALAGDPALLIADEPTTALDVSVQASILKLLNRLRKERQMSLIFISHDLGVVKQIADRTLVMYKGQKVEEGETTSLFNQAQHVYTKALLQCRPAVNQRGYKLPTLSDFFTLDENGNWLEKAAFNPVHLEARPLSTENIVEVKSLEVVYKRKLAWGKQETLQVIRNLSFGIKRGETLCLLGESGSGKSTLGRAIMHLVPYSGQINWKGQDMKQLTGRKAIAQRMQLIYQDPYSSLNPKFRISQVLDEVLRIHGMKSTAERMAKACFMMEKVGLTEADLDKYPHEFSGGQRQRISIARALILEPEFVVCDESVSALDVSVQAQVLNLMKDLQKEMGLTYLFITHDLYVARYIADRILVLDQGKIAELRPTEELFDKPENAYTKSLLAAYS